jgi:glycogen synthase
MSNLNNKTKNAVTQNSNILMIGWEFPPMKNGGLGVACYGLLKALEGSGIAVDFALPYSQPVDPINQIIHFADDLFTTESVETDIVHGKYSYDLYKGNSFELFKIPGQKNKNQLIISRNIPLWDQVRVYGENIVKYLHYHNLSYNLIHAHDWLTLQAAINIKAEFNIPFLFHVHATEWDRCGDNGDLRIQDLEKKGVHEAEQIICVSEYTKNILIKYYNADPKKIVVIHNGVDIDLYNKLDVYNGEKSIEKSEFNQLIDWANLKNSGYKIVLFVGRLTYQKGVEYLLKAAKLTKEHHHQCLFLITGRGDMEADLIQMAASFGLGDTVIFCGWQNDKSLSALYLIADIFVMPSRSEPFGLVALEAAIHNTPTIISKFSGAAEVMPHSLQIDPADYVKMSNYILSILEYDPLSENMSVHGSNHVNNLLWTNASNKLNLIYNQYNTITNK